MSRWVYIAVFLGLGTLLVAGAVLNSKICGLLFIILFTAFAIIEGKRRQKESIFWKYNVLNPDAKIPRKLKIFLLVLGTVAVILNLVFTLLKRFGYDIGS